jgi:RNA 2',3'-cyclic 3'-phosphodiesterase
LFVALELDDSVRRAIAALQQRIARTLAASSSMKMVDPAHMHLTLAFLGEIAERDVPAIVEALSIDIGARPFAAEFQSVGVFPPRGAPRVLWLGVGQGETEIIHLQQEVVRRLERLGTTLERRPFHPHLTLARWRTSRPADRECVLSTESHAVARVHVDRITLYQSRLSAAGPAYTALTHATLT